MGFFATLGRMLGGRSELRPEEQQRLLDAWKVYEVEAAEALRPASTAPAADAAARAREAGSPASEYDAVQWQKKLKSILDRLPGSRSEWADLMADVAPLGLKRDWVEKCQRDEFTLLVRRAVADARVTPAEHEKLEVARVLIGLSEDEAERVLHEVVAEAEAFFGKPIRGTQG